MTEKVELQNQEKVLIFAYNPNSSYREVDRPFAKGTVVGNELSDDMSYHGSPTYYRIYTVIDENGKTHKGTHMSGHMDCGGCFFKTAKEQMSYLRYRIKSYEEDIQKISDKIKGIEEEIEEVEKELAKYEEEQNIETRDEAKINLSFGDAQQKEEVEEKQVEDRAIEKDKEEDNDKEYQDEEKREEKKTTNSLDDIVNPMLWGPISRADVARVGNTTPKYSIGEIVNINTWTGMKYGFEVQDIKVTYHPRYNEYVWGYAVYKEGERTGLTFTYIPEGYLRKKDEE